MSELTKREFLQQFLLAWVAGKRAVTYTYTDSKGREYVGAGGEVRPSNINHCLDHAETAWDQIENRCAPPTVPTERSHRVMEAADGQS